MRGGVLYHVEKAKGADRAEIWYPVDEIMAQSGVETCSYMRSRTDSKLIRTKKLPEHPPDMGSADLRQAATERRSLLMYHRQTRLTNARVFQSSLSSISKVALDELVVWAGLHRP